MAKDTNNHPKSRSARMADRIWYDFKKSPQAILSVLFIIFMICVAIFAPHIAKEDPINTNLLYRLKPPYGFKGYEQGFYFGTDALGRDVFARMVYGARVSLLVGFSVVLISGTLGTILGILAGYFGGRIDDIIMRLADIQLAFPFMLLMLAVLAVIGPGMWNLIWVLGLTNWVSYARVVRGQVLSIREKEFVEAARELGASDLHIMIKHIFPNVLNSLIVIASFSVASAIISEATLSFLGLGVPASTPSWGTILSEGRSYITRGWWLMILPGLAIALTVLAINILGDWLRDIIDPKMQID